MKASKIYNVAREYFVNEYLNNLLTATGQFTGCKKIYGNYAIWHKKEIRGALFYPFMENDEYVMVTCKNGYHYFVNITGDSLMSIAESVLREMMHHV
jgi:hypothetical protein